MVSTLIAQTIDRNSIKIKKNLQQFLSSWAHAQSTFPSHIWFWVIQLLFPQWIWPLGHILQFISSDWSLQSRCPSQRQSWGMHLLTSHWNPLGQTITNKINYIIKMYFISIYLCTWFLGFHLIFFYLVMSNTYISIWRFGKKIAFKIVWQWQSEHIKEEPAASFCFWNITQILEKKNKQIFKLTMT